jgi:hypothetical protein
LSTIPGKYLTSKNGNRFGDYQHGRRVFADNQNELVPKFSFLYHVYFELNTDTKLGTDNIKTKTLGLMVKSVDLPKFTIQTKDLNAYNQHIVVQTGIKYDPITIQFHDDSADLVREFWYNYMTYYYGDAYNDKNDYHTYQKDRYQQRTSQQFGYAPRDNVNTRFLNSVKLYSMSKGYYSEYTLVNPTIDSWQHGTHQAGQNEFIGHTMRLKYETVLYDRDVVSKNYKPLGFAQEHYDNNPKGIGINDNAPYAGLAAAPGYVFNRNTGLPQRSNSLLGRLGNFALNTAIGAAQNRLARTKLGNGFAGVIARNAANAAFSGVTSAVTNKANQFFPSLGKVFTPAGTSSADVTGKGSAGNQG